MISSGRTPGVQGYHSYHGGVPRTTIQNRLPAGLGGTGAGPENRLKGGFHVIPVRVDAPRVTTYIRAVTFFPYWIRLAIYTETIMTAQSPRVRSIVPGTRRVRLVEHIHTLSPSGVTERPAPLARLEGPDISLSGRQILLKTAR